MKVVVIGGGTAGAATAAKLRRLDENCEIVILEKSNEFAVSNCAFPYYMSGQIGDLDELVGATPEEMRSQYNIEVRLNSEVENINREEKTVKISGRGEESYDKLVIANGAMQFRPDIEGVLSEKVFTIRSLESVVKLKNYIQYGGVKRVIILGGGYVGIEMAESFSEMKLKVSIVENSDHILPNLDYDMAAPLQNMLRERGIKLFLKQSIVAFGDEKATLSSGETLEYDLALIATGVRPDLKLPILANLEIGDAGGIKVNEHLQTTDKDIYAVGDNIEIRNLVTKQCCLLSSASLAIREAKIAAENIAGLGTKLPEAVGSSITQLFEFTTATAGANEAVLAENGIAYQKVHLYQSSKADYLSGSSQMLLKLLFADNGEILGIQGVGKSGIDTRIDTAANILRLNGNVSGLENAEICYAPAYSTGNDALNSIGSLAAEILRGAIKFAFFDDVSQDNVMLIDVRSPEAFDDDHIYKAINIPLGAIRNNLDSIPHDKKVITYCNRGRAAYKAACILNNRGFDNVYVLSGGKILYDEIAANRQKTFQSLEKTLH